MKLQIEITDAIIRQGNRQSCSFCPVALGIIEKLDNEAIKIRVAPDYVGIYPSNSHNPIHRIGRISLPYEVRRWIIQFDTGDYTKCEPFAFELEIPETIWKIMEKRKNATKGKTSPHV